MARNDAWRVGGRCPRPWTQTPSTTEALTKPGWEASGRVLPETNWELYTTPMRLRRKGADVGLVEEAPRSGLEL
jgi:hypothetical protein